MSLREYQKKRDFKNTSEPSGKVTKRGQRLHFVIQKHDASHLHYDFRLEVNGVLKSWAVPKGPSLDPTQKRLAMQVEDHPYGYGSFEGTIPKGQYGGGTVMLWDNGEWIPDEDPAKALKKGAIKFELKGHKLAGRWTLLRMKKAGEKAWLLIKEKDPFAKKIQAGDILQEKSLSIKTGRDLAEIAAGKKALKKAEPKKSYKRIPKENELKLSHPEKIYYPKVGLRKVDLAEYYLKISDRILEHIADRPLMLVRCPNGEGKECFHQKHWTDSFPPEIHKVTIKGEAEPFFNIDSAQGLLALAQLGTLEIHMWNTHFNHIENPDQWVFDLDPDESVPWKKVTATALRMRELLAKFKLKSFVKTTGGKGLHIVVPVAAKLSWDLGQNFAKAVCEDLAKENPALYLVNMSKAKRKGKIFLDYLRNARGATAVAPYSPRARAGAPVSFPVSWAEIEEGLKSDHFNLQNALTSLKQDPWKEFYKIKQVPKR